MWRLGVYGRGIVLIAVRVALLVGIAWGVLNWGEGTLFGLPQPWATLVAVGMALVAIPVLGYMLFLAVVLLYPVITGKRVDWR